MLFNRNRGGVTRLLWMKYGLAIFCEALVIWLTFGKYSLEWPNNVLLDILDTAGKK